MRALATHLLIMQVLPQFKVKLQQEILIFVSKLKTVGTARNIIITTL